MVNYVTLNSNTYSDGNSDEGTGKKNLGNGGHKKNLVPLLSDFVTEAGNKIAATGASLAATSTTSIAVASSGSIAFTIQANKGFGVGSRIRVARTSAPATTWMEGIITAFTQSSGATTFTADLAAGSGTYTDWTITLAGERGAIGATGATGQNGVATVAEILGYIIALS